MCRACQARIEAVHGAQDLHGPFRVGHGRADERLLPGTALALGIKGCIASIIGGAPVTQAFADQIGADGYSADAPGAVKLVKALVA